MSSRAQILSCIREALRHRAPRPGQHGSGEKAGLATSPDRFRHWLPLVGPTFEEQCQLFAHNAAALKAEFKVVPTLSEARAEISRLAHSASWKRVGTHSTPLTDEACRGLNVALLRTDRPYQTADLQACDAGLTACEALIAQTGTVLVTSRTCGGRALSVLPPHHVVLASRDQLLPDLPAAFELLGKKYQDDFPSCMSLITGPSRTGDIERILVLGAHGPKQLTILLVLQA